MTASAKIGADLREKRIATLTYRELKSGAVIRCVATLGFEQDVELALCRLHVTYSQLDNTFIWLLTERHSHPSIYLGVVAKAIRTTTSENDRDLEVVRKLWK